MSQEAVEALSRTNFTHWDWGIVAVYLLISVIIGITVKKYATGMTNYIGAGRSVGTWLGVATMTGTELGLVTVMFSAEKGYKGGFAAFHIAILAGLVTLIVGVTGFIVAALRRYEVLTIPEFYERRFGRKTRILGGIMLAFAGILNMGLFLQVGSKFIVGITGLSQDAGVVLPIVMTTLLVLVLIYTVLGGMISVIITDYVQFVVLSMGLVITTILAINHLGWENIFATIESRMGAKGFDPLAADSQFGVEYVIWMAMLGLVGCAVWPTSVARALAMESPQAVKRQYMWSSISFTIRFLIPYFWGICAYVFIVTKAPDLEALIPVDPSDFDAFGKPGGKPVGILYAMPIFLGRILPAGMIGVISAAMIAAFMSTHDSYLLCWSSVITQDVVAPLRRNGLSAKSRVALTRGLIVAIGAYIWIWGMFYEGGDDIWDYMAITGAIYFTSAFALLVGGLYWKRASSTGAFCALLAGFTAVLGLAPLRIALGKWIINILGFEGTDEAAAALLTSPRVGLTSVVLTLIVFVVASLLFPDRRWVETDKPGKDPNS